MIDFDVKVEPGYLWVQGDNRSNSADSRVHLGDPGGGQVPADDVVGKVFAVVWPFGHAKALHTPATFATCPSGRGQVRTVMSALPRGLTVRKDAGLYGYERALRRVGLDPVAGVDEAGRGACAGPLVAAAVVLPDGKRGQVPGLADSKLLTAAARERAYVEVQRRALAWSVVVVEPDECDRLGMHVANVEALRRSLARLDVRPSYVLTDGFPVDGLEVPGPGDVEGRPGRRLHRGRVGDRQGDPGPDHDPAARRLPGLRLRDAQGLHHPDAHRGARGARARARSTGAASSTCAARARLTPVPGYADEFGDDVGRR